MNEWKECREALGVSQSLFAQLMGVHPLTVSRWERGKTNPRPLPMVLMRQCKYAARNRADIGERVKDSVASDGVPFALYEILKAACDTDPPRSAAGCR